MSPFRTPCSTPAHVRRECLFPASPRLRLRTRSAELGAPQPTSFEETLVIEHVSLRCNNVRKSRAFYERALAPLGYRVTQAYPDAVGFMAEGHTSFWVTKGRVATPSHIAFRARSRRAVEAFH